MTKHERTIEEHVTANLAAAIDQSEDYEFAGDSFAQNTYDSCIEDGHADVQAAAAKDWFCNLAHNLKQEAGVTFVGDSDDDLNEDSKLLPLKPLTKGKTMKIRIVSDKQASTHIQYVEETKCKLLEVVLPADVKACWVEMNGKQYYLDDTTDEGIAECNPADNDAPPPGDDETMQVYKTVEQLAASRNRHERGANGYYELVARLGIGSDVEPKLKAIHQYGDEIAFAEFAHEYWLVICNQEWYFSTDNQASALIELAETVWHQCYRSTGTAGNTGATTPAMDDVLPAFRFTGYDQTTGENDHPLKGLTCKILKVYGGIDEIGNDCVVGVASREYPSFPSKADYPDTQQAGRGATLGESENVGWDFEIPAGLVAVAANMTEELEEVK